MMNLYQKTPSFFRFLTKIQKMIRLALICMLFILIASCAKEQDDLDKNLTIDGQNFNLFLRYFWKEEYQSFLFL